MDGRLDVVKANSLLIWVTISGGNRAGRALASLVLFLLLSLGAANGAIAQNRSQNRGHGEPAHRASEDRGRMGAESDERVAPHHCDSDARACARCWNLHALIDRQRNTHRLTSRCARAKASNKWAS